VELQPEGLGPDQDRLGREVVAGRERRRAGRAFEALKRRDEAMAEYAKALEVVPGAESASIALASLQFINDDHDAAVTRLNEAKTGRGAITDPGRLVGYGSFMHWPSLVKAMRAEIGK